MYSFYVFHTFRCPLTNNFYCISFFSVFYHLTTSTTLYVGFLSFRLTNLLWIRCVYVVVYGGRSLGVPATSGAVIKHDKVCFCYSAIGVF